MANPWGEVKAIETLKLGEIMDEEYAHRQQVQEVKKMMQRKDKEEKLTEDCLTPRPISYSDAAQQKTVLDEDGWEDCSMLLYDDDPQPSTSAVAYAGTSADASRDEEIVAFESDKVIAQLLQSQYDHEYNEELRRIEQQRNKQSKVTVTLDNFRRSSGGLDESDDYDDTDEEGEQDEKDWDRFETNEKILDTIPKCGFRLDKEGDMITKHDPKLCGVRNACRVMSFPPEIQTGDGAGFDMKLSNEVYNHLKIYTRRGQKKNKLSDRNENKATAEMGMDKRTRLLLYKLINNKVLEQINGIVSTGKEAVILHANSDPAHSDDKQLAGLVLPNECAIKVFKTTLNEFKQRDRYIKDDYRFKERFSKQNHQVIINLWAEKEMHNLMRMQSVGINCPQVVILKKHVLVMSFIGHNHNAAPKLKDVNLSCAELSAAYEEIVETMHILYNQAKLVHADLSEYNILWWDGKCWFIDVAQSVEPEHPSALEFLMRDCCNIINFFTKRGVPNIYSKEQLFEHITALDAKIHNAAMLERIHTRGASIKQATLPNQDECPDDLKPLTYPFELAWEKSQDERQKRNATEHRIDQAVNTMQVLSVKCGLEAADANLTQTRERDIFADNTAKN